MKALLIKMASIANELDLNGFEKEANEVTEAMARMAQVSPPPPAQMKERLKQEQYKIQQSTINELNKFVTDHNLSKQDAYAWITGKYGPRVANDWSATQSSPQKSAVNGPPAPATPPAVNISGLFSPTAPAAPAATTPAKPSNPMDVFNLG